MSILKNVSQSTLNFILRSFNNLVIFGILVRIIGLDNFGFINYLITLVTLIFSLSIYGYRMQIIKEVAGNVNFIDLNYVVKKLIIVFIIYIICMIFCWFVINNINTTANHFYLFLFCTSAIFFAFSGVMFSIFQSINKFYYETICLSFFTVFQIIGLYFTNLDGHLKSYAASYWIGSFVMCFMAFVFFYKYFNNKIAFQFSGIKPLSLKTEFAIGLPFALMTSTDIMFSSIDLILLEQFVSMDDVGMYSGASKIVLGLTIFSTIIYTSLLPIICNYFVENSSRLINLIRNLYLATIATFIIVSLVYFLFYRNINDVYLGKSFSDCSSLDLSMFIPSILLFTFARYLAVIPSMIIIASNSQSKRIILMSIIIFLNILCYYLFVPRWGALGAFQITTFFNLVIAILYTIIAYFDFKKLFFNEKTLVQ